MQVTVEMINKGKELLHADLYVACTGLLKKAVLKHQKNL